MIWTSRIFWNDFCNEKMRDSFQILQKYHGKIEKIQNPSNIIDSTQKEYYSFDEFKVDDFKKHD